VLFLVFGSSAGGKTTALNVLRKRMPDFAIHDFDEVGVPPGADTAWRHRASEQWVQRALEYQAERTDLLLAGQTPYGELLAAPSAPLLDGISGCLFDCSDEIRAARLESRGATWFTRSAGDFQSEFTWPEWIQVHLDWAVWMRAHAADPTCRTSVIKHDETAGEMHWSRWRDWRPGDPRWRVRVIDTSDSSPEEVADELLEWVAEERNAKMHLPADDRRDNADDDAA
jgi:hypothetical protein